MTACSSDMSKKRFHGTTITRLSSIDTSTTAISTTIREESKQSLNKRSKISSSEQQQSRSNIKKKTKEATKPRIVNMVCSGEFDWWHASKQYKCLDTIPILIALRGHTSVESFRNCITHLTEPKVTVQLYPNGTFTISGAKETLDFLVAIQLIIRRVYDATRIVLWRKSLKLDNIVMSFAVGYPIDLDKFYRVDQISKNWTPEKHSGLKFYPRHPNKSPCVVVFDSGAVNILGCKSIREGNQLIADIDLTPYRLVNTEQ